MYTGKVTLPFVTLYNMSGIQWTYSTPGPLGPLIRHVWDTVDLFYPQAFSHLIRHAWDTVDLVYPWALRSPDTTCLGYSGPILPLGP